jgi:hypothetical protein
LIREQSDNLVCDYNLDWIIPNTTIHLVLRMNL